MEFHLEQIAAAVTMARSEFAMALTLPATRDALRTALDGGRELVRKNQSKTNGRARLRTSEEILTS